MRLSDDKIRTLARVASEHGFKWYINDGKFYVIKGYQRLPYEQKDLHYEVKTIRDITEVAGL